MKKTISVILSLVMVLSAAVCCGLSASAAVDYRYGWGTPFGAMIYPSQEQIINKAKELNINLSAPDEYREDYSLDSSAYAAGVLSDKTQQEQINLINFYRYIAGLPADVEYKEDYGQMAAASALVNAANGSLSHYPEQPAGMDNALYQLGYEGSGHGNIALGYDNLSKAMVNGWMDDSNASNIPRMGHRRWVLYPFMKYVGFGSAGTYQAMYAHDRTREGQFIGEYVAWPGPNTPVELFSGSVFSFNLGIDYDEPAIEDLTVTVTSAAQNKTWTITQKSTDAALYVNNQNYGLPKCIIFKAADFVGEDTLRVHISGTKKNGKAAPIDYTVNLFSMTNAKPKEKYVVMRPYRLKTVELDVDSLLDQGELEYIDWDSGWQSSDSDVANVYRTYDGYQIYTTAEGTATLRGIVQGGSVIEVEVLSRWKDLLLGDADDDGSITIIDAVLLQRHLAKMDMENFVLHACDVDNSGNIDVVDAIFIQRHLAKMKIGLPIGRTMQQS